MGKEILIVEDEDSVARFLHQALREEGYSPTTSGNGETALQLALTRPFDLVLLDLMLPGLEGVEVCRRLRQAGRRIPVMMITARDTTQDKITGLDAGADDYIVKPFVLKELLARIRALLRRVGPQFLNEPEASLQVGALSLDQASLTARLQGQSISLSATECSLLEILMRRAGSVITREELLEHVWQYDFNGDTNVLHVYISYLRGKLEGPSKPKWIHTVRGVGYRLQDPAAK